MDCRRYALMGLLFLLAATLEAQTSLRPEAGVLLLRNGQVLSGLVTRAGDYYIVTLGETGEVRLPSAEVEALCGSLDEVYEFKMQHLPSSGVKPHLALAEWCLRQNLPRHCSQQLILAMRIDPDNEQLKHLERRLELAIATPPPPAAAPQPAIAAPSNDQLEKSLRTLPPGSIEKFSAVVQPILLNRCGANQCHGPAAKSEFRLLRPPEGQIASRRFTQRNLHAALAQLDMQNPEASPLVKLPQGQHGSSLAPIFDKQTQHQLAELLAWVKLTAPPPPAPAVPATIGPANQTLSQPAGSAVAAGPPLETAPPAGPPQPAAGPATFTPRDRYDPEIFNRRYHGK